TLADLKGLPLHVQGILLLKRLAFHFPIDSFSPWNLSRQGNGMSDPGSLATGFPDHEIAETVLYLLDAPLRYLQREGYISERLSRDGFFDFTPEGRAEINRDIGVFVPNRTIIASLNFLHPDLRGYEHYCRENKLKDAVAAAFKHLENRLNQIRDASTSAANKGVSGVNLPYKLFETGELKFPYPNLSPGNQQAQDAYLKQIKGLITSGIGWFRNSFDHEPHNLPKIDEVETLEHLFVASYMLHLIDRSV
ncbi:MAG: TIGR02391 family protein, partial [Terracidiphilus sp.]